jgi:hypothetical protein
MKPPSTPEGETSGQFREADGIWGDTVVEVKAGARAIRGVRDGLLHLAYRLADRTDLRGLLVLLDSTISRGRLDREREAVQRVLHPEIARRLEVLSLREGDLEGVPTRLGPEFREWIAGRIRSASTSVRAPREVPFEVMKVLVHQLLLGEGPVAPGWIARTVGCSYPTVARSLKRLEPYLRRTSDRQVALERFPAEEWSRLLADSDRVRPTLSFVDRSGQPRAPGALLARLARVKRRDVAVGGVEGARHYHPDIDLVGAARLELTWHCPPGAVRPDFVTKLDAALEPAAKRGESPVLVVHILRRDEPLFQPGSSGVPWADPVECLLDLQGARLIDQADEFVAAFLRRRAAPR